jgi:nicotinamidase-related amidase
MERLDPTQCALVAVDLQQGIVALPAVPHPASAVVEHAAALARAVRDGGGLVVWVRVTPRPDGKDALQPLADLPTPARPSRPDWAELVPELGVHPDDLVVTKRQWGAFHGTELDLQLRRRGLRTVILCGISTCVGVESTARAAFELGYQQVFVEDACAARAAEEHAHTVTRIFPRIGRVRRAAEVLAALRGDAPD